MCGIWVAIARRLGLQASLCNFPGQILVTVQGHEPGSWADRRVTTSGGPGTEIDFPHWVDVFAMDVRTITADQLPVRLGRPRDWTIPSGTYDSHLAPADVKAIVQRTASNIAVSLRTHAHSLPQGDVLNSCQAAALAFIACHRPTAADRTGAEMDGTETAMLSTGLRWLAQTANMDESAWLDADLIQTALNQTKDVAAVEDERDELRRAFEARMAHDEERSSAKLECVEAMASGKMHPVGTLMRHAKYGYVCAHSTCSNDCTEADAGRRGIVCGGDTVCRQSQEWMRAMNIDELADGRDQPFYQYAPSRRSAVHGSLMAGWLCSVLNSAGGSTYVANENVVASFLSTSSSRLFS